MKNLPRTLHQALEKGGYFPRGARILIGVSGGLDSVCLTYLLHDLARDNQWDLALAHLNHGIRGRASDADASFVRELARSLGLRVHRRRVDVPAQATAGKISLEMAARAARYDYFAHLMQRHRYDLLALAHTRDDQAETVLLRLLRGTGPTGLGGMSTDTLRETIRVVRPLLEIDKSLLRAELERRGASWREDASNEDSAYTRNRVRHELIPFLEKRFNPKVRDALTRAATLLREDEQVLEKIAQADWTSCIPPDEHGVLDVVLLNQLPKARQRRVVRHWLLAAPCDPDTLHYETIDRILRLCARRTGSASVPVDKNRYAVRTYQKLLLTARDQVPAPSGTRRKLLVPGETDCPEWELRATTAWARGYPPPGSGSSTRNSRHRAGHTVLPAEVYLSADWVGRAGLYLRTWRAGDRFTPIGMKGSRKVQDIFVDQKVPRALRERIPLLECRKQIIWIPGYRIAADVAVQTASARSLRVRLERCAAQTD